VFGFLKPKYNNSSTANKRAGELLIGQGVNLDNPTVLQPIYVSEDHRRRGMMVVGTTGVGKTRLEENFIEDDILTGKSVVCIDPKGDQSLFAKIYDVARRAKRLDEIQLVTVIYPEHSAVIDPMAYYFMVDELVGHIVAAIPPSKEEFFRQLATAISTVAITANIIIANHSGTVPNQNLDHLRQCVRRQSLEETKNTLLGIGTTEATRIASMIDDLMCSDQEHFAKVSMSLSTTLMTLSSGNIGKIIGQADSNRFMKRLEQGKRVILVVHTGALMVRSASSVLGRLLISMIQGLIGRTYNSSKQKLDIPLSIHIDEAHNVLYDGFENLTAMAGSANVMTTLYIQDIAQLKAAMKSEDLAQVVLNTCNTKIFLRCPDAVTSEYVVKHFGTRNVLSGIYGTNQVTTREIEQEAVKTYEVLSLQPREFLMTSYSGRFKGTTAEISESRLKIIFPSAPGDLSQAQEEEREEEEII
jgi:hypothetical protein